MVIFIKKPVYPKNLFPPDRRWPLIGRSFFSVPGFYVSGLIIERETLQPTKRKRINKIIFIAHFLGEGFIPHFFTKHNLCQRF